MDFILNHLTIAILSGIAIIYLLSSIITFATYRHDKRLSERNAKRLKAVDRVSEKWMHSLEFLGGWPGGLIAQRTLHHKNKKRPYQVIFWVIVAVHLLAWAIALGIIVF